jgi:hypothetical protein
MSSTKHGNLNCKRALLVINMLSAACNLNPSLRTALPSANQTHCKHEILPGTGITYAYNQNISNRLGRCWLTEDPVIQHKYVATQSSMSPACTSNLLSLKTYLVLFHESKSVCSGRLSDNIDWRCNDSVRWCFRTSLYVHTRMCPASGHSHGLNLIKINRILNPAFVIEHLKDDDVFCISILCRVLPLGPEPQHIRYVA